MQFCLLNGAGFYIIEAWKLNILLYLFCKLARCKLYYFIWSHKWWPKENCVMNFVIFSCMVQIADLFSF
jgi:hypothetical protein